jgi:hypothetical protein
MLGISLRHTRRLLAAYRRQGASALAHGNRRRSPVNKLAAEQGMAVPEITRIVQSHKILVEQNRETKR